MTEKKNINEATLKDIESLPFMNTERARLVTDYISNNGPLNSIEEVDNITGIGEKLSNLLMQHFDVGSGNNRGGNNRNQGGGGNHGNANK